MSGKELASARSYWKRGAVRAGRRSRYVEVREASLETVRADAVECGLVDEVVAVLGTGKEADVYVGLWKHIPLALKVYRIHRTEQEELRDRIRSGPDDRHSRSRVHDSEQGLQGRCASTNSGKTSGQHAYNEISRRRPESSITSRDQSRESSGNSSTGIERGGEDA